MARRRPEAVGVAAGELVAFRPWLVVAVLLVASCAEVHRADVELGPDDELVMANLPLSSPPISAYVPVGDTCFAIGFGSDETPYRSDFEFIDPFGHAIQDALSFPGSCPAAIDFWFEHDRFDDPERELLRVEITGRVEQTFSEDFSHRFWTGEVHYTEAWEGGRARVIVLDHVPSVPAD